MTKRGHLQVVLAAVALCAPFAGCGDDDVGDPIRPDKASRLETEFDAIRDHVDADLCEDAQTAVNQARGTVDTLDEDGVGSDVQDALGDGVDNLGSLVSQECEEEEEVETTPETTPETAPETVPPPTETVPPPTETVPPPTEEEEPEEEEPDEEGGGIQFDPNVPPGQQKKAEEDG